MTPCTSSFSLLDMFEILLEENKISKAGEVGELGSMPVYFYVTAQHRPGNKNSAIYRHENVHEDYIAGCFRAAFKIFSSKTWLIRSSN